MVGSPDSASNFENQLTFGKIKAYKNCANFLGHPVGHVNERDDAALQRLHVWRCIRRRKLQGFNVQLKS